MNNRIKENTEKAQREAAEKKAQRKKQREIQPISQLETGKGRKEDGYVEREIEVD